MDIWIVIDRYDHSDSITTAHLTKKGALIEAFNTLIESYDNIVDSNAAWVEDDEFENDFHQDFPDAYEFVKQHKSNISEAKTADLDKYISDLVQWVGEHTDWSTDVTIQTTRLQA